MYTTEFRALDVRLGRWMSPDALTDASWSRYEAMNDNPINLTDMTGLEGEPVSGPNDGCTGSECSASDYAAGLAPGTNGGGGSGGFGSTVMDFNLAGPNMAGQTNVNPQSAPIAFESTGNVMTVSGGGSTTGTRIWGALSAFGGLVECSIGSALIGTGIGSPLGILLVVHGADVTAAGFRQLATGKETHTFTFSGVKAGAQALGASEEMAGSIALGVDMGIGVLGGGAGAMKLIRAKPAISAEILTKELVITETEEAASSNASTKGKKIAHHIASNKHLSKYTPQFEAIANKYKLDLDAAWNKIDMSDIYHYSKHPNQYHEFVLKGMQRADAEAAGDIL